MAITDFDVFVQMLVARIVVVIVCLWLLLDLAFASAVVARLNDVRANKFRI